MKFKVLRGWHEHGGKQWGPGMVVESTIDLADRFNGGGRNGHPQFRKFEQVIDATPADPGVTAGKPVPQSVRVMGEEVGGGKDQGTVQPMPVHGWDTIQSMNVADLKRFAEAEEIDLGSASRRDDILAVIRQALESQAVV